MQSGETRWSGVMIDAAGRILTTSRNLGNAPLGEFTTNDGRTGQAWVVGRNDTLDIALLEPMNTAGNYNFSPLGGEGAMQIDGLILAVGYPQTLNSPMDKRTASIVGLRTDLSSGTRYLQLQVPSTNGLEGGGIFNNIGQLVGTRMTTEQMVRLGLGRAGEFYAMDAKSINDFVLAQLEGGLNIISKADSGASRSAFPGLPAIYAGVVRDDGVRVSAGSSPVFARIVRAGQPDAWYKSDIFENGVFQISVSAGIKYSNSTVEFWRNQEKAEEIREYSPGFANVMVDLTF
tara:strand:- start:1513 stop:2379 length:867 start_codon:yes stop_codon:yes gene_type:complete